MLLQGVSSHHHQTNSLEIVRETVVATILMRLLVWTLSGALVLGKRRELEALLARLDLYEAKEAANEAADKARFARRVWKGSATDPPLIDVSLPRGDLSTTAADFVQHVVASNGTTRLSLRVYLLRAEKSAAPKRKKPMPKSEPTDAVFAAGRLNWNRGGFTALGRGLGLMLAPARAACELLRLATRAAGRLAHRHDLPRLARGFDIADAILRRGPFKALPDLDPRFDLARNGRTSRYYAHYLDWTATARATARLSWRTPADAARWCAVVFIARRLDYQRLEAAMLRAAAAELRRVIASRRASRTSSRLVERRRTLGDET